MSKTYQIDYEPGDGTLLRFHIEAEPETEDCSFDHAFGYKYQLGYAEVNILNIELVESLDENDKVVKILDCWMINDLPKEVYKKLNETVYDDWYKGVYND